MITLTHNEFANLTDEEFRALQTLVNGGISVSIAQFGHVVTYDYTLPRSLVHYRGSVLSIVE